MVPLNLPLDRVTGRLIDSLSSMTLAPICPSPCEFCLLPDLHHVEGGPVNSEGGGIDGAGEKVVIGTMKGEESTGAKKPHPHLLGNRLITDLLQPRPSDKLPPSVLVLMCTSSGWFYSLPLRVQARLRQGGMLCMWLAFKKKRHAIYIEAGRPTGLRPPIHI